TNDLWAGFGGSRDFQREEVEALGGGGLVQFLKVGGQRFREDHVAQGAVLVIQQQVVTDHGGVVAKEKVRMLDRFAPGVNGQGGEERDFGVEDLVDRIGNGPG